MDTGARYVSFGFRLEDLKGGQIVGLIIPAEVDKRHLDQVFGEIRDFGGVRFVVVPREKFR
jgi:hypothetical protein